LSILNTKNFKETHIDLSEPLDELDTLDEEGMTDSPFVIRSDNFVVSDGMIFCHAEQGSRLALVDLNTKKLLWYSNIKIKNYPYPYIRKIELEGGRLYVLDMGGGFHVFAKKNIV
jgi:hypothetical protein